MINNRGSNDGLWKEVRLRKDNNQMLRVQDWLPYNQAGSATAQQNSLVIGTQFGADGALYMARYPVTCCRNNVTATSTVQIVKITFDVYEETDGADHDRHARPGDARRGPDVLGPGHGQASRSTDPANADPALPIGRHRLHRVPRDAQRRPGRVGPRTPTPASSNPFLELGRRCPSRAPTSVEYRAVDRGGNTEATKTVTFSINRPTTRRRRGQRDRAERRSALSVDRATFGPFIPGVAPDVHRDGDGDRDLVVGQRHAVGLRPRADRHQRPPDQRHVA